MSIEKLTVNETFPAGKGQESLVRWIIQRVYYRLAKRCNWILDRLGNGSGYEFIDEGNGPGDDGNWRIIIDNGDLATQKRIGGAWSEAKKIHGS